MKEKNYLNICATTPIPIHEDGVKKMYFPQNIAIWHIYLCPACNLSTPPKDKWVVTVGRAGKDKIYGFFINTAINPVLRSKEELLKLQITISPIDHPFLRYDSYVNCSKFIEFYPSDFRQHQKEIAAETKSRICAAVLASSIFTDDEKARLAP